MALRHFETVYGGVLALAATYVEPGVVVAPSAPSVGIAWIGAFPDRAEPRLDAIARDLRRANLETLVVDDISRVKNAKLVDQLDVRARRPVRARRAARPRRRTAERGDDGDPARRRRT